MYVWFETELAGAVTSTPPSSTLITGAKTEPGAKVYVIVSTPSWVAVIPAPKSFILNAKYSMTSAIVFTTPSPPVISLELSSPTSTVNTSPPIVIL